MDQALTHIDSRGQARMVDVGAKPVTERQAIARGKVIMNPATLNLILEGKGPKGDVLAVARVAGIMAAKKTGELIPLCHPLNLSYAALEFRPHLDKGVLEIEARVKTSGQTGVELEALAAVSVAALTIYDMCKAVERGIVISDIRLVEKSGGRSGVWQREGEERWNF
ncbi:cyclic pyranopterin monophosphate synthase subunit MoaC [Thermanaeromonas toyohensis ToBE]|uniref:Cyclic pyranopterin monophosphate synthase n=1 Tax=Thermanaeromonas toyohensis ToBE TaxID=698762 RepID=A0A1W1W2T3_9FIRM|nr:cyclic pyranopterin monophosphate synthase MoaC [Thermanaeromonas toyohensis]SMB99929.1 cyclic pyranopterin monophosphate synthase subunit MoaC [Thermanaeromonas toyohensis ToBE]